MKELTKWWSEAGQDGRTWLILGKGPSFDRQGEFDLSRFRTLGLNHVPRYVPVDVASVIDLDVVAECGEAIEGNAKVLLMPRYPHINFKASDRPIEDFFDEIPILRKLSEQDRLIWYNFVTGKPVDSSPTIHGTFFSAEVMVNLLAVLGVRTIRTLGVDGGTAYSSRFSEKTKLANQVPSFDFQWKGITTTVHRHAIDYAPLTTEIPIRVFIGTDDSQKLGAKVLEYSIKKHCPIPVVCDTMDNVQVRRPKEPRNQSRTEFSFNRFAIPELAGFKGRAVYLDADMQVFRNFQELWDIPFGGARVLYAASSSSSRPKQFSVLLLNCEELNWDVEEIVTSLDEDTYDYDGLMNELCIEPPELVQPRIPPEWNSLEEYERGRTALIHYTDMLTQPWVSTKNPNCDVWVEYLKDAVKAGFITFDEIEEAVARGYVRPSLPRQLRLSKRHWHFFSSYIAPIMDRAFKPHRKLSVRLANLKHAS